jgi:hypothetical protein
MPEVRPLGPAFNDALKYALLHPRISRPPLAAATPTCRHRHHLGSSLGNVAGIPAGQSCPPLFPPALVSSNLSADHRRITNDEERNRAKTDGKIKFRSAFRSAVMRRVLAGNKM